ncbi:MAG: V-type ATP synthase subunit D [Candidatus Pacebacteria bacterium]|nr:V-type ATP synthase subunit D [Candidatus Paceibacterota bacterium]MDD3072305.1 V-type ATP synthase subunit D [Candidatus Paceibacterota bacterium]MDD3728891.1 V-type ATP synthase subunit D [Candidatus Paceibacterota bacterium]MDD4201464.1 V-type ATP synthase subunit D [Candidatus Paceibacterota bacterium]MDD4467086.1 V-type ATP synthase subunit D [Candidatus Paceibacterota bacterium]
MKSKINPTRQELLKLKKRLKIAKSGHKLLKEKLEGLMREFLKKINDLIVLRKKVENELPLALLDFFYSSNVLGVKETKESLSSIPKAEIEKTKSNIMGVEVNDYRIINKDAVFSGPVDFKKSNYRFILSKKKMASLGEYLMEYASLSLKIRELASEIEKNRRRVNSLEHVYIPEVERAKKYITQKLEEGERFERTVALKLKTLNSSKA